MAIDEQPFDALQRQFENEERAASPITNLLARIASGAPLPWPFDHAAERLKDRLGGQSIEKVVLLLQVLADQVHAHDDQLKKMRETTDRGEQRKRIEELQYLLLDGARKAEATRSKERVRRIGVILANASVVSNPDSDDVEEMMRVAVELSENDVICLRELVRIEGENLRNQGRITRYDAHNVWEKGAWSGLAGSETESVFSKLESYGLVSRVPPPNNVNLLADFQYRFALLPKGLRFVDFIKERSRT